MKISQVEDKAKDLLDRYNLKRAPIPVEEIAKQLGMSVVFEDFKGDLSGVLYRDDNQVVIGVNSMHAITRQRFTIAHEIGHFVLHQGHPMHLDRRFAVNFRDTTAQSSDTEEIEANAFAASLLMPEQLVRDIVIKKLRKGVNLADDDCDEIPELARMLKVSQQALLIRLGKLGLI